MSLSKCLLLRLNSNTPLSERCQFARDLCKNEIEAFGYTCKAMLVVNWLCELLDKVQWNSSHQIWDTLNMIIVNELQKGSKTSLVFKCSLVETIHQYLINVSEIPVEASMLDIFNKIVNCISLILQLQHASTILVLNPKILLQILALILKHVAQIHVTWKNVPESLIIGIDSIVTYIVSSDLQQHKIVGDILSNCLQGFINFTHKVGIVKAGDQHCSLQSISVKVKEFIKEMLCHTNLTQSYKISLKLEQQKYSKVAKTNHVENMLKNIEQWLRSEDPFVKTAAEEFTALLLEGFLERSSVSSIDLPFSLLIVFTNMFEIFYQKPLSAENISKLNQLLVVCAKTPLLIHQNGKIPQAKKMQWFHTLMETILNSTTVPSPSLFQCFSSLIPINSDIVEQQIESLWSLCLVNAEESENYTKFLCLLLQTFTRLRKVPKLFWKLSLAMKNEPHKYCMKNFPQLFLLQFSGCIISLPIGQTLELWNLLLETTNYFLEDISSSSVSGSITLLVELLSMLLTHMKLTANDIPSIKVNEVKTLMQETEIILSKSLTSYSNQSLEILSLCYAWGEASLTISVYEDNISNNVNESSLVNASSNNVFDLTELHSYITAEEWITRLNKVSESKDLKHSRILLLLLIQKVRCISKNTYSDKRELVKSSDASYILNFVCERTQSESNEQGCYNELWDTVLPWLSLLVPAIDSKLLIKLCKVMSLFLLDTDIPNTILSIRLLKSNFFLESRSIQTALITSLWSQYENNINTVKRKLESTDEEKPHKMLKSLSKHPRMWQKFSETKPEVSNNDMWSKIHETATTFSRSSENLNQPIDIETGLKLVQTLCHFPLEDMEPGNQMRCVLGALHILSSLINTKQENKTQLVSLLCQVLMALLQKIPASRMALIFEPSILLNDIFDIFRNSPLDENEQKWTNNLLDKIIFTVINDESVLPKIESFTNRIISDNGNPSLELKFLEIIVKRVMTLLKRNITFNRLESFQSCDQFAKTLVSKLNMKLLEIADLDHKMIWESFHCILSYHCTSVPSKMKCIKRKPKQILKQHPSIVASLTATNFRNNSESKEPFLKLVGLICENRNKISKILPEKFISCIWPICMQAIMANSSVSDEAKDKNQLYTLGSILKCCKPEELATIIHEINSKCANMILYHDVKNGLQILKLWTKIIATDFVTETPKPLVSGICEFMKIILPLVFQLAFDPKEKILSVLQILAFVSDTVQKSKQWPLKHGQILLILQACSSVKPSLFEPLESIEICNALLKVYQRLLARKQSVILKSVAPFLSCLSVVLRQLITIGNQVMYNRYKDNVKSVVLTCAQDFSKLLAMVSNYKTEFSKQAIFIIAEYLSHVQNITVNPLVKEELLLGIYKLMDISDEHATSMLQISLATGGREIFNQLRQEFNQHYRYKGKV